MSAKDNSEPSSPKEVTETEESNAQLASYDAAQENLESETMDQEPEQREQKPIPSDQETGTTNEEPSDEEAEMRNKGHGTTFPQLRTSDQETRMENLKPRSTFQQPGTANEDTRTSDLETEIRNQEPAVKSQEYRSESEEFKTADQDVRTKNKEARSTLQEPATMINEPRTSNQEIGIENQGSKSMLQQPGAAHADHDLETVIVDQEPIITVQESRPVNEESRMIDQEVRTKNKEATSTLQKSVTMINEPRTSNQEIGTENQGPKSMLQQPVAANADPDLETGIGDKEPIITVQESRPANEESRMIDQEVRTKKNKGARTMGRQVKTKYESRSTNQESGREKQEPRIEEKISTSKLQELRTEDQDLENVEGNQTSAHQAYEKIGQALNDAEKEEKAVDSFGENESVSNRTAIPFSDTEPDNKSSDSDSDGYKAGNNSSTEHPVVPQETMAVFEITNSDESSIADYLSRTSHVSSESDVTYTLRRVKSKLKKLKKKRAAEVLPNSEVLLEEEDLGDDEDLDVENWTDESSSPDDVPKTKEVPFTERLGDGEDWKEKVKRWLKSKTRNSSSSGEDGDAAKSKSISPARDSSSPDATEVPKRVEKPHSGSNQTPDCSPGKKFIDEDPAEEADNEKETDAEEEEQATRNSTSGLTTDVAMELTATEGVATFKSAKGQKRKRITRRAPRKRFRTLYLRPHPRSCASSYNKASSLRSTSDPQCDQIEASLHSMPEVLNIAGEFPGLELGAEVCIGSDGPQWPVNPEDSSARCRGFRRWDGCIDESKEDGNVLLDSLPEKDCERQAFDSSSRRDSERRALDFENGEAIGGSCSNISHGVSRKRGITSELQVSKKSRTDNSGYAPGAESNAFSTEDCNIQLNHEPGIEIIDIAEEITEKLLTTEPIDCLVDQRMIDDSLEIMVVDQNNELFEEIVTTADFDDQRRDDESEIVIVDQSEQISSQIVTTESTVGFGDHRKDNESEIVVVDQSEQISEQIVTTESTEGFQDQTNNWGSMHEKSYAMKKDAPFEVEESNLPIMESEGTLNIPATDDYKMELVRERQEQREIGNVAVGERFETSPVATETMGDTENDDMTTEREIESIGQSETVSTIMSSRTEEHLSSEERQYEKDMEKGNIESGVEIDNVGKDRNGTYQSGSETGDFENTPSGIESPDSQVEREMVTIEVIVETQNFVQESNLKDDETSTSVNVEALADHDEISTSVDVDELEGLVNRNESLSPTDVETLADDNDSSSHVDVA